MCLTLGELYGLLAKTKYILSYHHHFLIILSLLIIHYCIVNILSLCIHIYIYIYVYIFSFLKLITYFLLLCWFFLLFFSLIIFCLVLISYKKNFSFILIILKTFSSVTSSCSVLILLFNRLIRMQKFSLFFRFSLCSINVLRSCCLYFILNVHLKWFSCFSSLRLRFFFFSFFFRNIHERDRERKRSKRMKFIRINVFGGHYLIAYMWHISITLKIYCSFFFLFLLLFCFFLFSFVYDENNTEIFWDVSLCIDWRDQKHNLNLSMTRLGRVLYFLLLWENTWFHHSFSCQENKKAKEILLNFSSDSACHKYFRSYFGSFTHINFILFLINLLFHVECTFFVYKYFSVYISSN